MKQTFTFSDLSKIFSMVEKISKVVNRQIESKKESEEKDKIFDVEFKKYGYTFFNAPGELHVMFAEKCAMNDEVRKAERKAYKTISEFAAMLGVGENYGEWYEDVVKRYVERKEYYNVEKVAEYCKSLSVLAAHRIAY